MSRDNKKYATANEWPVGSPPPTGYIAWHEWAASQHKGGLRQKQCPTCKLWKFPQDPCGCSTNDATDKEPR